MFGYAFYRQFKYKMVTHARVFSLKTNFYITKNQGLFLVNSLYFLNKMFGYENMCSWEKIKDEKIFLPKKNGEIDFDFMESFISELEAYHISELEAYHISELEAYLLATGLKDYTLTEDEKLVLENFEKINWKEYTANVLFEINKTLNFNKDKLVEGTNYDYITRTLFNQGVFQTTGFINKENINPKGTWSLELLKMTFFYRKKEWYAGQFIRCITPKFKISCNLGHFIATMLNMQSKNLTNILIRNIDKTFRELKIKLPIKNDEIDFDFMEVFISAIQKLVIKDVVLYADRKILETKKLVNN